MYHTNIHERVHRRPSEVEDDDCCCLPVFLSLIDLIPFLCLVLRFPAHLNESPPLVKFGSQNNQTWSQLFANCSYQQNSSGNYSVVCDADVEPVSIFFLTAAFVLALALLLFNIVTMTRKLTQNERIIRTTMHMIYAFILFTTALTYTLTHYWCSSCRVFLFICIIPIPTTLCMPWNWYDGREQFHPHQQRSAESQSFELAHYTSNRLPSRSRIIVSNQQHQPSLSIPRLPLENNADPQSENEYNEWLETQQHQN
jgi:hypothetical protein